MVYPTFKPISHPDGGVDRTREPVVRVNQYGDGYEQVTIVGINSNFEEISPKWTNANQAEATYIQDFLNLRKGLPFLYRMNDQGPLNAYRCTQLSVRQKKGNYWDISAKFKQTALV